ncbi:MAG: hypothetical protein Q8P22_04570, partial [Chloroflexota bacterium]|nr:hypothetical protein [Chloroflexota bacterium]
MAQASAGGGASGEGGALSLSEAAALFLTTIASEEHRQSQAEVYRFARWYGADRPVGELRGHDVALYAESLGPA